MMGSAALPPAAGPGDRVGVAALSGPVDGERLERGLAELRRLGFEPVLADNARAREGLFAGGDRERLAAFHRLAADPRLAVIFFTRGGHGLLRLLPAIDWELLARRPRAYVGYSDLTPFLLQLPSRLGLVAFHGPLVGAELAQGLSGPEESALLDALAGRYPAAHPLTGWLRRGRGEGPLLGGCLSLLAATLGTPYFPDLSGALLFWEETNEPPYRLDRMLTHLWLSGNLAAIEGMVVGHLPPAGVEKLRASARALAQSGPPDPIDPIAPIDWRGIVADSLASFRWPLGWGLEAGHSRPNRTLPLGLPARLDPDGDRLLLGWPR
jgi:muramoyltetrapeptide carboxypeptidase